MKTARYDPKLPKENKGRAPYGLKKAHKLDRIIEEIAKNHKMFFQEKIAPFPFKLTHQIME
jgi:hypothetical protein